MGIKKAQFVASLRWETEVFMFLFPADRDWYWKKIFVSFPQLSRARVPQLVLLVLCYPSTGSYSWPWLIELGIITKKGGCAEHIGVLERFLFFHILGIIIPTDFHSIIFQRVGQPPTRYIMIYPYIHRYLYTGLWSYIWIWGYLSGYVCA